MDLFDEWSPGEDEEQKAEKEEDLFESVPRDLVGNESFVLLSTHSRGEEVNIFTRVDLTKLTLFNDLHGLEIEKRDGLLKHTFTLNPANAFLLRHIMRGLDHVESSSSLRDMKKYADQVEKPYAVLAENRKMIDVHTPPVKVYRDILKKLGAKPLGQGVHKVSASRVMDFEAMVDAIPGKVPKIKLSDEIKSLTRESLPGFDGGVNSLKGISVGELNTIKTNSQSWKSLKKSKMTLQEKIEKFGLKSLHDMLFYLPRRYIDRSKPQDVSDLIEDETATVVGKISFIGEMPKDMGPFFKIKTETGGQIRVSFFKQFWLKRKFKIGDEVLVTGKVKFFRGERQLNGSGIEHADEAAILPIVPVYRQSESQGITTNLILNSNRELISRMGRVKLPPYFSSRDHMTYSEAIQELHLPSSLDEHKKALDVLAYYELVYMQLIVQNFQKETAADRGMAMKPKNDLQEMAKQSLPFSLTSSQDRAVSHLNELASSENPFSVLLNADVGAGKTLVAQFACLRAVDSGGQAIIVAPTDILARQLHKTFANLLGSFDNDINLELLTGSMKASEKKPVIAGLANGEVDIAVGTHSLISENMKYHDLRFVAFDEQQKFGAEQRTSILRRREDGLIPDFLMQSATPIPRSAAQVFYGDMDMVELTEKPPGRLPIVTEWIEQNPQDVLDQIAHEMWNDVRDQIAQGNQVFVTTPMVNDSSKIEAASVKRTFERLTENTLSDCRVAMVSGQMKNEDQKQVMQDFRDKKYDVLVASTVVEVGVDIPDATRMVILSADRLGASSLHQIRGRIGRNDKQSKCYLVSNTETENGIKRLSSLVDSEDGFDIAKVDLEIRGEGSMFDTDQSGHSSMQFASILKHSHLVKEASEEASRILGTEYSDQAIKDAVNVFESNERLV